MANLAYMPFYPADYLGSPSVQALSLEAQGAYVRLLSRMWLAKGGTGRLPDDDRTLCDLVGIRIDVWRRIRKELVGVIRFEGGECFNDRQQLELAKAQAKFAAKLAKNPAKNLPKQPKASGTCDESPKKVAGTSDFSTHEVNDSKHIVPVELELELELEKQGTTTRRKAPRTERRVYSPAFVAFWEAFPGKRGSKAETADLHAEWIESGENPATLELAAKNYAIECIALGTEPRFTMHGTRFLARKGQPWLNYTEGWKPPKPRGRPPVIDEDYRRDRAFAFPDAPPEPSPPAFGAYQLPPPEKSEYRRTRFT